MLLKKLLKTKVYTSLGDAVGPLVEIYLDHDSWEIKYVMVSRGFGKQNKLIYPIHYLISTQRTNLTILPENVAENVSEKEVKPLLAGNQILGLEVLTNDDKPLGKLYDVDISVSYKKWSLWKLLIRTGRKERRLRLDASEIASIKKQIKLQKTLNEIEDAYK